MLLTVSIEIVERQRTVNDVRILIRYFPEHHLEVGAAQHFHNDRSRNFLGFGCVECIVLDHDVDGCVGIHSDILVLTEHLGHFLSEDVFVQRQAVLE